MIVLLPDPAKPGAVLAAVKTAVRHLSGDR